MRKAVLAVITLAALVMVPGVLSAAPPVVSYTGFVEWTTPPSCLTASQEWATTGTKLAWTVTQDVLAGPWTYNYTLTVGDDPAVSHWILELTPGVTKDSIITSTWNLNAADFKTHLTGDPSNPGLPCEIYGVKFDNLPDDVLTNTFTFTTNIAPVWGDFYAKGGVDQFVYNSSFCSADPTDPPADNSINCKILRPDSGPVIIPEPGSMFLALVGALPMIGYRLRRR